MYQFILIAGLPGCGKTTLAQQLDKEFILFDDLSIILINQKTTLKEFFQQLIKNKNSKVIITDPNLVIPGNQEFLINEISQNFKSFNLEFIFFENNPRESTNNAKIRNTTNVSNSINNLSKLYGISDITKSYPYKILPTYHYDKKSHRKNAIRKH